MDLPPAVLAFVATHRAPRTGPTGDAKTLTALLAERGHSMNGAVLAFEESYGGLCVYESEVPSLVIGAYARVSGGARAGREAHLVPVIFASDDVVYSLDAEGRGWTCATMVEGVSRLAARDGRQLLTQAILWRALVTHAKSFGQKRGRRGDGIARERNLAPIVDASSEHERWWGDLDQLVVEIDRGNGYARPMTFVAPPLSEPPPTSLYHQALVVDLGPLHALRSLVSEALATKDDSLLHEFILREARAKRLRDDARPAWVDAEGLLTPLAQIASIEGTVLAEIVNGARLLEVARDTPTRARNVARNALEKLTFRAARLKKLVQMDAPPPILENEVPLLLHTLEALDRFDLSARGRVDAATAPARPGRSPEAPILRDCLQAIMVDDTQPIGTWDEAEETRGYVDGPLVFARPTESASLAAYEVVFSSFEPRLAEGGELVATLEHVRHEPHDSGPLARYAEGLSFAIEHQHVVVEWVVRGE